MSWNLKLGPCRDASETEIRVEQGDLRQPEHLLSTVLEVRLKFKEPEVVWVLWSYGSSFQALKQKNRLESPSTKVPVVFKRLKIWFSFYSKIQLIAFGVYLIVFVCLFVCFVCVSFILRQFKLLPSIFPVNHLFQLENMATSWISE